MVKGVFGDPIGASQHRESQEDDDTFLTT